MALPIKGTRRVSVDGEQYRWLIRKRPTYCQAAFASPMTIAVQCVQHPERTLVITTTVPRSDNWLDKAAERFVSVTPFHVAEAIRQARGAGWRPEIPGSAFKLQFDLAKCQEAAPPNGGPAVPSGSSDDAAQGRHR